jgi:hypothetical protein
VDQLDYFTNMQLRILVWLAGGLTAALAPLGAQTPPANKNDAQAQELLRRAAGQQQASPAKASPSTAAPVVTNTPVLSVGHPTRAELDRQYLDGRLTAKQFQKALAVWLQEEQKRSVTEAEKQRKEAVQRPQQTSKAPPAAVAAKAPLTRATSPRDGAATPVATPPPGPSSPSAEPTPQQARISEVEARIDQMLRQKEAREKAALTNAAAATNNVPAGPLTKRQRMDALLRQFVEGTLPEAEYNARRAKILAEPN